MQPDQVILVNEQDQETGVLEKIEAHRKALLHRAFSVFIFDSQGRMLLQRRALSKYHSAGLWTNACCSHPRPGEGTADAAKRRLQEELGFTAPLEKVFAFTYRTEFDNGLTEHEYDHVYTGYYDGVILPNPEEVAEYAFRAMDEISTELATHPQQYTSWFHLAFPRVLAWKEAHPLLT